MINLNGWQRLWLVISLLWVVTVVTYSITNQQTDSKTYHAWSRELLGYLVTQVTELKGYSATSLRSTYSDLSDKELIEALHKKYLVKHPAYRYGFEKINLKYENKISKGRIKDKLSIQILLALGIPISLYFFGWAISWVRNGFNNS